MISAGAALALRFVRSPEVPTGGDPEFARVLRIADPSPALEAGGTFLPPPGLNATAWVAAWELWRDQIFADLLAPVLTAAHAHASLGQAREIRALDLTLPAPESLRSVAAGLRLFETMSAVRGERWLTKLQTWAADGTLPAHFALAYACRYASFHLPGRLLLPTYAYWEWTAALALCPPAAGALPEFAVEAPAAPPSVESETALRASTHD